MHDLKLMMARNAEHATFRLFDIFSITLLAIGCSSGLLALIVNRKTLPTAESTPMELRMRVKELEQRLLDRVPKTIEQGYRDL